MRIETKFLKRSITLLLVLCCCAYVNAQQQYDDHVVAGFYPYTKDYVLKPENIPLQNLTHLIYCFAGPRADGSISTETGSYHNPSLVARTHAEGKKFILMMGGGLQSGGFHAMTSSAATRTIFINTLVDWFQTYGYDGVNIDWEYPGDNNRNEDRQNLTALVTEMRQAFTTAGAQLGKHLEISMDVHSSLYYSQWVDFATLKNSIDWFGLMSYDYSGNWSYSIHAAHNAPLYCGPPEICDRYLSVDTGVKNLTDSLGIPASQIVMGVAFYGREFYNSALYETPREGGGGVAYYDIAPLIGNGWTRHWDEQSRVPYLLKTNGGSGFISYDDEISLKEKADYIKQKELLGAMVWEITQDVDKVTKQQPLLNVIGNNLVGVELDTEGKPTVALTAPANNLIFTPGSNLLVSANATVETGFTIQRVEFYRDAVLLSSDFSSPYSFSMQNMPSGSHILKAIAYSNNGKSQESSIIKITDGILPSVTEMFDDFSYANSTDPALNIINKWTIVDGVSGPPSGAVYSKDLITFYADPSNSTNIIMGVATQADNNPQNTRHSRIETEVMPYRNGTFAARVYFDDTPATYGDGNVETFYTINSYATCNQADLYSECDFEYLPWDAWHWERKTTMYTTTWETCEIRTHDKTVASYQGWHDLIYTAENGQPVRYYIDGQLFATHDEYQPDSDVNISFANWIYQNITGSSTTQRTTRMQVDWVYHSKDAILSRGDVLAKVNSFRSSGILRKNLAGETAGGSVNPPPTVAITAPVNGTSIAGPTNITINATASDSNGSVASVSFYNGTQLLGTDTTSPYSFVWNNVSAGTYTIRATATDNGGANATAQVEVTITGNTAPTVAITSPTNNATFFAPAAITINASASDSNGTIASVAFFNGNQQLGIDNTSPYSFVWNNVATGTYTLRAVATDNQGATATSTITISVVSNVPPTISITAPANNATFYAPASITLSASASDTNGSVTSVTFYSGTEVLSVDTSSPYEFNWNNVRVGMYSITAVAKDNQNATTTSSPVSIHVITKQPVQLSVVYRTIVSWDSGFQGEVRITNNSSTPAANWIVNFDCPHTITPLWDAVITSHVGTRYEITGTGGTTSIPGNQSVVFGFIGNITTGQTFTPPYNVSVMGGSDPAARMATPALQSEEEVQLKIVSFPNPFTSVTTIEFTLPEESHVELTVYDMKGVKLSSLINRTLVAGKHSATWDATNYPNGMYFYKLRNNKKTVHAVMIKK